MAYSLSFSVLAVSEKKDKFEVQITDSGSGFVVRQNVDLSELRKDDEVTEEILIFDAIEQLKIIAKTNSNMNAEQLVSIIESAVITR